MLTGGQILELITGLRKIYPFAETIETTIEANPGTVTDEKIESWLKAGINRVSLGVQSLDDGTLATLGRIHNAEQARNTFQRIRKAGFEQASVDLMYGIEVADPLKGWKATLEEVISWEPDHISAYSLIVEEETEFAAMQALGVQVKCDEEIEVQQYEAARKAFFEAGYEHYEVSNWARPGHRCRHNISYWDGGSYLALGPSGHSYDASSRRRFWNYSHTQSWVDAVELVGLGEEGFERLTPHQYYDERLMLGLRMVEGMRETELAQIAEESEIKWPPEPLEDLIRRGHLERVNGILRYTHSGLLIADELEAILTA